MGFSYLGIRAIHLICRNVWISLLGLLTKREGWCILGSSSFYSLTLEVYRSVFKCVQELSKILLGIAQTVIIG